MRLDLVPLVARIRDWCDTYLLRHVGPVSTCGDSWCAYCGNQCHACGRIVVNTHLGRMPR